MFVYQLIFYLQGIYLFNTLRQFADTGNAVEVHHAHHLRQYTGEV